MRIATLNITGPDTGLDGLVKHLGLSMVSRWRVGDLIYGTKTHDNSGIEFDFEDAQTSDDLVLAIRNFLRPWSSKNLSLAMYGLDGWLSVGVTVGDSKKFTAHIRFSANDMLLLGTLGIELRFTAYPTSDEANELDS
jgi:hypothetical protein